MKPLEFLSALWDDITGKDANGRDAETKKRYSTIMVWLTLALAIALSVVVFPYGLVGWLLFARKLQLHLTNTF